MEFLEAVVKLRPGSAWNMRGDVLEQVEDGTPRVDAPSQDEIQGLIEANAYKDLRRAAYPAIGDQLDAIWKGGADFDAMRDQIMAVKSKFPKEQR